MQRASPPAEVRIADEMLTILAVAALENDQIDRAMTGMGTTQNLKKEENVVVARGGGSKSTHAALGQAARQGLFGVRFETKGRYLGSRLTWNMSSATERDTRIAAAWNAVHMMGQFWKRRRS